MANPSVPTIVNQNVSISDANTPANQVKVNADGSLNTIGTLGATDMLNKTGSQTAAAVLFTQADCTDYYSVSAQITSIGSGNTVVSEISNDGTTWFVVNDQLSGTASITAVGEFVYLCSAKQFRMRVSVYSSGTVSVNANLRGSVYQQNVNTTETPSSAAANGIVPVVSASLEASHVLKASAGNLYGIDITTGATAGFLMIFDATSAPGDGAVTPKKAYQVAANSSFGAAFQPVPLNFATGITVVFSSTGPFTKTASATAFFSGEVV